MLRSWEGPPFPDCRPSLFLSGQGSSVGAGLVAGLLRQPPSPESFAGKTCVAWAERQLACMPKPPTWRTPHADPNPDAADQSAAAGSDGAAQRRWQRGWKPPGLSWVQPGGPCCARCARRASASGTTGGRACGSCGARGCGTSSAAWRGSARSRAWARAVVHAAWAGGSPAYVQPSDWHDAAAAAAAPPSDAAAVRAGVPPACGPPSRWARARRHARDGTAGGARPRRPGRARWIPSSRWVLLQPAAACLLALLCTLLHCTAGTCMQDGPPRPPNLARWQLSAGASSLFAQLPRRLLTQSAPLPPLPRRSLTPGLAPPGFAPSPGYAPPPGVVPPPGFVPPPMAPPAGAAPPYGTPQYHAWLRRQQAAVAQRTAHQPPPPPAGSAASAVKWEAPAMPQAYTHGTQVRGQSQPCTCVCRWFCVQGISTWLARRRQWILAPKLCGPG